MAVKVRQATSAMTKAVTPTAMLSTSVLIRVTVIAATIASVATTGATAPPLTANMVANHAQKGSAT